MLTLSAQTVRYSGEQFSSAGAGWLFFESSSRSGFFWSMISAQTPLAFVARENRFPPFRIMLGTAN